MKNKILSGGLLALILTTAIACNQNKEEAKIDKDQIKAEIQAIENKFATVYNTRNADSLTYYAEDAISYFAGLDPIVGKDAIHQHIRNELADLPEGSVLSFETVEIYITDNGDRAVEIGAHSLADSTGAIIQKGHYVSFFAKIDGKFFCIRDMANSVQMEN